MAGEKIIIGETLPFRPTRSSRRRILESRKVQLVGGLILLLLSGGGIVVASN